MKLCPWCNERPSVYQETGGGCNSCPTIPYRCTCDTKDEPHKITCERSPHFSGERVWDEEREVAYNLGEPVRRSIEEVDSKYITSIINSALERLMFIRLEIDRIEIIKCEQDIVDPTKFTVEFEWIPE